MTATLIKILFFVNLNIYLTIGEITTTTTATTTTTVNVVFPHPGIQNDVEMSEEHYKALTGNIDYDSDNYQEDSHNFYGRDDLFKWNNGIVPYEFDKSKPFDQDYQDKIKDAIEKINLNLIGCVLFR